MNELTVKTKAERDLEKIEHEINTEAFEAFVHVGQKLLTIKRERLYESAGFKTWNAYCASGRIDYKRRHADDVIRAAELRPKIGAIGAHDWTERQLRELCKCETDNDAKRVAKKAISLAAKSGQRVTAKLIAQVRDGIDETGATVKKQHKQLQSASLETHLATLADVLIEWRASLEQIDLEQWESVPSRILTRVRREADALSTFLRS